MTGYCSKCGNQQCICRYIESQENISTMKTVIVRDQNGREVFEGDRVILHGTGFKSPPIYGVLEYDKSFWAHVVHSDGKLFLLCDVLVTFTVGEDGITCCDNIEKVRKIDE